MLYILCKLYGKDCQLCEHIVSTLLISKILLADPVYELLYLSYDCDFEVIVVLFDYIWNILYVYFPFIHWIFVYISCIKHLTFPHS